MRNLFLVLALLMVTTGTWAAGKVAMVKLVRGEAYVVSGNQKNKLKLNDWIETGAVLHTSVKSFVKLVFIDKSQMNIGPQSEIKIEKFHTKDAGVIDLVKGKIRSQVTKDYLQINGKDRSKLFIKTNNAVMGIRGTDFMISTNGKNTAAILFEGEVVFNRLNNQKITDSAKLDEIVDRGVRMFPGEFSAVGDSGSPTLPALLNVGQRDKLEKNANFNDSAKADQLKITKSIVPPGLKGDVASSKPNIDVETPKVASASNAKSHSSQNPNSYFKDGQIKPANGSMIHLDSATIIAPGADAILDENTNTYIASEKSGAVNGDGSYTPPTGVVINRDGNMVVTSTDGLKTSEVKVDSPIIAIQTSVDVGARTEQLIYTVIDYKEAVAATTPTSTSTATDPASPTGTTTGTTTGGTTTDGTTTGSTTLSPVKEATSGVLSGDSAAINLVN